MPKKKQETRNPLDSIAANGAWVDALLELFWAVDEVDKGGRNLPPEVKDAYDKAEAARRRL